MIPLHSCVDSRTSQPEPEGRGEGRLAPRAVGALVGVPEAPARTEDGGGRGLHGEGRE